jgi:2-oxoglutarate ferredoxin oxidoreductase subunit delta
MEGSVTDIQKITEPEVRDGKVTAKAGTPAKGKSQNRKKHYDPVIISAWCKSCGICSEFCPKNVIGCNDMGAPVVERPDDCTGCRFCEFHCPDFAIAIKERKSGAGSTKP